MDGSKLEYGLKMQIDWLSFITGAGAAFFVVGIISVYLLGRLLRTWMS